MSDAPRELPTALRSELALSRSSVDRAVALRGDPGWWRRARTDPRTRVLVVGAGQVAVSGGALDLVPAQRAPDGAAYLLGADPDGTTYVALDTGAHLVPGSGAGLREVGATLGARDAGLAVHAVALANWHATHGHCARCGAATEVVAAGAVRRCPRDGSEHYPRTDPAVIVAVIDADDRCLLGSQASWPAGRFSTLAGFVEPGESAEQAVRREVAEESGVLVGELRYAGSQPWPFPSSLMLGFFGRADTTPLRADGTEIAEVRWFTRDALAEAAAAGTVLLPPTVSIARHLIEAWWGGALPGGGAWR